MFKPHSTLLSVRLGKLALCLLLAGSSFVSLTQAEDKLVVPKFNEPEVAAYAKTYAEFTEQYIVAAKAAKAGDDSKMKALDAKTQELQAQSEKLAVKLKADETEKFMEFMSKCAERMVNASM